RSGFTRFRGQGRRPLRRCDASRRNGQPLRSREAAAKLPGFGQLGMALAEVGLLRLRRRRVRGQDLVPDLGEEAGGLRFSAVQQHGLRYRNSAWDRTGNRIQLLRNGTRLPAWSLGELRWPDP